MIKSKTNIHKVGYVPDYEDNHSILGEERRQEYESVVDEHGKPSVDRGILRVEFKYKKCDVAGDGGSDFQKQVTTPEIGVSSLCKCGTHDLEDNDRITDVASKLPNRSVSDVGHTSEAVQGQTNTIDQALLPIRIEPWSMWSRCDSYGIRSRLRWVIHNKDDDPDYRASTRIVSIEVRKQLASIYVNSMPIKKPNESIIREWDSEMCDFEKLRGRFTEDLEEEFKMAFEKEIYTRTVYQDGIIPRLSEAEKVQRWTNAVAIILEKLWKKTREAEKLEKYALFTERTQLARRWAVFGAIIFAEKEKKTETAKRWASFVELITEEWWDKIVEAAKRKEAGALKRCFGLAIKWEDLRLRILTDYRRKHKYTNGLGDRETTKIGDIVIPTSENEEEVMRVAAADEVTILEDLETRDISDEDDPKIWAQFATMMSTEWRKRALDALRRGGDVTYRLSVRHSRKWEAFGRSVLVQIAAKKRAAQAETQQIPEGETYDATMHPPVLSIPREEQEQEESQILIAEPDVVSHDDGKTIPYVPLMEKPIDYIESEDVALSQVKADEEIEKAIDAIKQSGLEVKGILETAEARILANPGEPFMLTEDEMKRLDEMQAQRAVYKARAFAEG
ncbi:uncharacterized protein BdWA1_004060 [Babesia duncani]|nr:hypothetical protein BdWA1_004060 [Babesia duncani]